MYYMHIDIHDFVSYVHVRTLMRYAGELRCTTQFLDDFVSYIRESVGSLM